MIFRHILSSFAFLTLTVLPVMAQAQQVPQALEEKVVKEVQHEYRDQYIDTSFSNLSKAYWAIGKFDLSDDKAIDNYLLINECETYLKYFHQDFEWRGIRDAARETILKNLGTFPRTFHALLPVTLSRYDFENEYFEFAPESKIVNLGRIDLLTNSLGSVCGITGDIALYPRNIGVQLNRPFSIEKIKVRSDLAQLYIDETQKILEGMLLKDRHYYKRTAYVRLKLTLNRFKEDVRDQSGYMRTVAYAVLDDWEVYADVNLQKPLYINELQNAKFDKVQEHNKELQRKIEDLNNRQEDEQFVMPDLQ